MLFSRHPVTWLLQDEDSTGKLADLRLSLINTLNILCHCGLTESYISDEELSCRGNLQNQIVYRGRVRGSEQYSSSDLVDLMQSWVDTGHASLMVGISRLEADPTCPVFLDNINSPDCSPPAIPPTSSLKPTPQPKVNTEDGEDMSAGELGGIIIGVLIVILLVLIVLVIALILKWKRSSSIIR